MTDMPKGRLEAFSDGVIAIIITIMVLELKVPHGDTMAALAPLVPTFLCYALSFIYVGIYWNNHHHMFHATHHVNGRIQWANLFLLFWLSLIPFTTGWMGENHYASLPIAMYGFVLMMAAGAYWVLQKTIIQTQGPHSVLAQAVGRDVKGKASVVLYLVGIVTACSMPIVAIGIYIFVAGMWLIPDRRIEKIIAPYP